MRPTIPPLHSYETAVTAGFLEAAAATQADKFQGGTLAAYDKYVFPGPQYLDPDTREPLSSAVNDFLVEHGNATDSSLAGLLQGISDLQEPYKKVHWVDMGGGRGLAQRQLATLPYATDHVTFTNVDLFDFGVHNLEPREAGYLEKQHPGITRPTAEPRLVLANAEHVTLHEEANLITAIQLIQYLDDPLASIANWYNQLAPGGFLVIAAEHTWSRTIHYQRGQVYSHQPPHPTEDFLQQLASHNIPFAITNEPDMPGERRHPATYSSFKHLAIRKQGGTVLTMRAPADCPEYDMFGYKGARYIESDAPIVTVTEQEGTGVTPRSQTNLLFHHDF